MKKILLASLFTISFSFIKAQTPIETGEFENIYFTNLYGRMIKNANASELENYHISNTNTGFGGDWGLDVKWWGGVKLRSALGTVYLTRNGNFGINNDDPNARLDVNGNVRINARDDEYTFLSLGHQANDQLIVDNTAGKSYGGGYFFRVHNENRTDKYIDAIIITEDGDIGIGKNYPQNKLDVAGKSSFSGNMKVDAKIEAREVKVTQTPTADFVFEENYDLPKLEDVEKHIKENKHLPQIAPAKEMEKEGINIGEFQIKLLQKIEELTLYSIEQNKQIKQLQQKNQLLEEEFNKIKSLVDKK